MLFIYSISPGSNRDSVVTQKSLSSTHPGSSSIVCTKLTRTDDILQLSIHCIIHLILTLNIEKSQLFLK